jgi:hypothetical protein
VSAAPDTEPSPAPARPAGVDAELVTSFAEDIETLAASVQSDLDELRGLARAMCRAAETGKARP